MSTSDQNLVETALEAGETIGALKHEGTVHYPAGDAGVPFLLLAPERKPMPVEHLLPAPLQARSTVKLNDAPSFAGYVNRFKNAHTVVFADLEGRKFEAVIDYHKSAGGVVLPMWLRHRAIYTCPTTPAWDEWTAPEWNGKPHNQVEFARFIEEHVPHIAEPTGAALLEMCLTLEAKKDVQFRSSTRLQDGQHQFRYEEVISGTASGSQPGTLSLPSGFKVAIEPFQGVGLYGIDARLRFRIQQSTLSMWFELVRPKDVLDAAFTKMLDQLKAALGETLLLSGAAPTQAVQV